MPTKAHLNAPPEAPSKTPSNPRKRKGEEDQKILSPPVKKSRVAKQPTTKAKAKIVINNRPSQRLDVYVFGEGSSSELGLGTAKNAIDVKRPRLNPLLASNQVGVVQMACGGMHVAALTHDNKILTWGVNDQGALGRDTTWEGGLKDMDDNDSDDSDKSDSGLNPAESNPTAVPASSFPQDTQFVKLAAGDSHTLALTDDGRVFGWGTFRVSALHQIICFCNRTKDHQSQKNDGVLGFLPNTNVEIQHEPILYPDLKNIVDISSGANHALAIDNKGAVSIWGSGEQNQLGYHIIERTGTKGNKTTLKPQPLRTKIKKYKAIYTGSDHSFAIDMDDHVWSWGVNSFGGTGIRKGAGDDNAVVYNPTMVETLNLDDDTIIHMDGGQHHSIAITQKGKALVWGRVDGYQTGLNMATVPLSSTIQDSNGRPRIVIVPTAIPGVGQATYASAGTDHTILLNELGHAYAWGLSATYQTGLATTDDVQHPTHIDNTAVRGKLLNFSACGGQFSILTSPAEGT